MADKKLYVSTADLGPQLARALAEEAAGKPSLEGRLATELGVELLGLARERPLSSTWRAKNADGQPVAMVVVADRATDSERELFARTAEEIHAAGESLPDCLRVLAISASRDAFLTDLWTAGSARDLSALKWSPRHRVYFVLRTVRALEAVHARGLLHGCLCPANVLLDDNLYPVLAEVGAVPVHALAARGVDVELYKAFSAPEVLRGDAFDARSDVYSAGRILEEVVRGDESPAPLTDIVKRSTLSDPSARYANATELATALDGILGLLSDVEGGPRSSTIPSPRISHRSPRISQRAPSPDRQSQVPKSHRSAEAREVRGPTPWRAPRALSLGGIVAAAACVAAAASLGGHSEALRNALAGTLALGVVMASTLVRPPAHGKAGVMLQAVFGLACGALVVVADPLSGAYRMAARRHLRGDEASRKAAIAEFVRLGRDFRGLSLAGFDLSGMDLAGADLRGVDVSRANLTGTRLFAADVAGTSFDGATLASADLDQVELGLANVGSARCDEGTRLPHGWRCSDERITRSP